MQDKTDASKIDQFPKPHVWQFVSNQHLTEIDALCITYRMKLPDGYGWLYWSHGQLVHVSTS